ncbi:hypothetical protein SAMN04488058_103161 [Deinococcus reticulitermitis]|uniref:Uncharacterized protein n=1 Tax=Deinococcus reticulitermitis TaxID=856736 RepID=A0A1H6VUM3_9DEIO|nr:hypothetical protein [Deinococcus reticulitermitis]SEJ03715.1 hypothetical protein SAMN04488058_103161 [Deinococcus reticulitermitis]
MGEAKRRKQLGLMPTVLPFEAELGRDGTVRLVRGPEDAGQRSLIEGALRGSQAFGTGWDAEFRAVSVIMDRSGRRYDTAADVGDIEVPELRRLTGELALGSSSPAEGDAAIPVEGGLVRLREQRHSFGGQKWDTLPRQRDPQRVMEALQTHGAFRLRGEGLGQYQVEQWREGRIDIDPEPPEEALEALEHFVRDLHGATPDEWADLHRYVLEGREDKTELEEAQWNPPLARRVPVEVRRSAPLQNPLGGAAGYFRDLEFYLLAGASYTHDGETWHSYDDPDAEPQEDGLSPELAEFFDMNMVTVTVHADGRVEWDEDQDIPEEHAQAIRGDLAASTGAGDPQAWADWTRTMLEEVFGEELKFPEDTEFPVPVAVRLDLPRDVLGDDSPLSQTYIESEVTFDGETWRDLYDEEVPEELAALAAGQEGN